MKRLSEFSRAFTNPEAFASNMTEQLRMAGRVQRDFLPRHLPNCSRFHWATTFLPAEWVSGDIYDIARLDEHHIGFYIADVVGHGMPAALLTIFLKQSLVMRQTTSDSYKIFTPSEVVKNLNLRMAEQKLSGNQFATCCYCLLNTETLQLTFARGGHPYPILIRPGQQPKQLQVQGSLLGIFDSADYPQSTVQLQKGDKLILYSDGVEQFIGNLDDRSVFQFTEDFCKVKDLPVLEMTKQLNKIVRHSEIDPSQADDIRIVALEIGE
jgi:phosphoserine phosphatase RsbU/P